jgi:hypothetical protein
MTTRLMTTAALLALLAAPAAVAATPDSFAGEPAAVAASQAGPGWSAWIGCWRPTDEGAPLNTMVCVVPGETATSVRMISLEDGSIVDESVMHADGVARAVEDGGCTGTETAGWSQDARRVFVRTELDCAGVRRVSTGVLALIAENEWVDIQALEVADQHASRSMRYRAVRADQTPAAVAALLPTGRGLLQEAARLQAAAPLGIDEVVEATGRVSAPVLEALIAARQHGFGLNAARLVQLQRRGVPASVIDMMIAVSYPQRFAVQERPRTQADVQYPGWQSSRAAILAECLDPYGFSMRSRYECDMLMLQYRRSGSRYGYGVGYSPWGYDPYGWNYGRGPIVVIVEPEQERQRGEVVRGRGYTSGGTNTTGRTAQPRGTGAATTTSSGAAAQPASSAGSTSTGSTSTGTPTGRTAVPRPPGGGSDDDGR